MAEREDHTISVSAERLSAWLKAQGIRQIDLAAHMNISPNTVWRWLAGRSIPDTITAGDLERLTSGHVMASGWSVKSKSRSRARKKE